MESIKVMVSIKGAILIGVINESEDFKITSSAESIQKLKTKSDQAVKEFRKVLRENNLRIPQKLQSVWKLDFYMKDYMKGGRRERRE